MANGSTLNDLVTTFICGGLVAMLMAGGLIFLFLRFAAVPLLCMEVSYLSVGYGCHYIEAGGLSQKVIDEAIRRERRIRQTALMTYYFLIVVIVIVARGGRLAELSAFVKVAAVIAVIADFIVTMNDLRSATVEIGRIGNSANENELFFYSRWGNDLKLDMRKCAFYNNAESQLREFQEYFVLVQPQSMLFKRYLFLRIMSLEE